MATFHFDLVSPEKLAFSGEVDQVDVPGVEGDFGVLAGHAPVVAAIRPGILTVTSGGTHQKIIVLGGLAEVSDKGLTVLADVATSMQDLDRGRFADKIADMEAKLAEKEGSELDRAVERLDHFNEHPAPAQFNRDALAFPDGWPSRLRGRACEFRENMCHRAVGVAPERHHEIGNAVEPLPSPSVEFRRLAVARRQRIDLIIASCETQREPFLPLAAEFRQAV
jgi:F-type H+-transporting ATPase subunit epsilon